MTAHFYNRAPNISLAQRGQFNLSALHRRVEWKQLDVSFVLCENSRRSDLLISRLSLIIKSDRKQKNFNKPDCFSSLTCLTFRTELAIFAFNTMSVMP